MEDLINEYQLKLKEIRSCIIVLQQAIQNENKEVDYSDVDNYLEIILEKINKIIKDFNVIKTQIIYLMGLQEEQKSE